MSNSANPIGSGNVIIQEANGSTISVNLDNGEELKELIHKVGTDLRDIPQKFLRLMEGMPNKAEVSEGEAKIYLTVLVATSGYGLANSQLKFSITITNLHKEHRYFVNSYFVVSPGFTLEGGTIEHDTFSMVPEQNNIYPKRLEYGEPISVTFAIKPGGFYMYEELLQKEENSYIKAYAVTSLGEVYESNAFEIKKLVEYYHAINNA
jgi:hypothetical protein